MKKYDIPVDCNNYSKDKISQEAFEILALEDKKMTMIGRGIGVYVCYCKKFSVWKDFLYPEKSCYRYRYDKDIIWTLSTLNPILTVLINGFLKDIVTIIVKKIGYKLKGEE